MADPMAATPTASAELATATSNSQNVDAGLDPNAIFRQHKHRVKVDGEDLELDYDDLLNDYQHKRASTKRFQEAAEIRKQVDGFLGRVQQGDLTPLVETMGYDAFIDLAQRAIAEHQQYAEMSDDQRDYLRTRYENEQLKRETQTLKQREEEREANNYTQQAIADIDRDIANVLRETGQKPTPRLVYNIAAKMVAALDNEDGQQIDVKEAYERSKRDMQEDAADYIANLDTKALLSFLPAEVIDAIRTSGADEIYSQNPLHRTRAEQSDKKYPTQSRREASSAKASWYQDRNNFFKKGTKR